jgi:hypothetical protein
MMFYQSHVFRRCQMCKGCSWEVAAKKDAG